MRLACSSTCQHQRGSLLQLTSIPPPLQLCQSCYQAVSSSASHLPDLLIALLVLHPCICSGFNPETGIVRVKMAGSCVGCPSSTATLRNGVENMLMHYISEVKGIEQVKDEAEQAGERELEELEKRIGEKPEASAPA